VLDGSPDFPVGRGSFERAYAGPFMYLQMILALSAAGAVNNYCLPTQHVRQTIAFAVARVPRCVKS